ncbi:AAA family ATPase [Metallosphaera hakonensis]|uniref:AAA family ATPase n=1 Tax=Metallosphaera hakonensis TaxID=79601 RepID=UPI000A752932|nr:ABC transporter ATP-binding protein [Metallosphaera hakonensis]
MNFIDSLGIRRLLGRAFSTLSTGEKKLVLITKALAEGELVFMDEPTSGLDVRNQARVISVISSLRTEKSFLITTHDLNWIGMADWVMVMKGGKIIWQSTANELNEEVLENAYESKVKRINVDGKNIFILNI